VAPDLDVLSRLFGKRAFLAAHQTWSHALPLIAAAGAAAYLLLDHRPAVPLALVAGMSLHALLDWTNTYGITLWLPFTRRRFCAEWVFFIDAARAECRGDGRRRGALARAGAVAGRGLRGRARPVRRREGVAAPARAAPVPARHARRSDQDERASPNRQYGICWRLQAAVRLQLPPRALRRVSRDHTQDFSCRGRSANVVHAPVIGRCRDASTSRYRLADDLDSRALGHHDPM
jgi:hypothetical protein